MPQRYNANPQLPVHECLRCGAHVTVYLSLTSQRFVKILRDAERSGKYEQSSAQRYSKL